MYLTCHWSNPNCAICWIPIRLTASVTIRTCCYRSCPRLLKWSEIISPQLVLLTARLLVIWFLSPSKSSTELFLKPWSRDPKAAHRECLVSMSRAKEWSCSVTMWHITATAGRYCINQIVYLNLGLCRHRHHHTLLVGHNWWLRGIIFVWVYT